jgi:hypothetical protein
MPYWSITIPTHNTHGDPGVHVFIVNADHSAEARGLALTRAALPKSRQRRRNADLNPEALTVAEISSWGL